MRPNLLLICCAALAAVRSAEAQYYEARNTAMGGTGTASSNYLAAGFANPARLTHFAKSDSLGLLIPTVGAAVQDKTDLISDIESFADNYDLLAAGGGTTQDFQALAAQLQSLSGRQLVGNLGAGLAVAMPSNTFAWSLHLHSYADVRAVAQIDPNDITALQNLPTGSALPTLNSQALVLGAGVSELGFSFARRFGLGDLGLSVGATPKFQRVDTYNYVVTADNFTAGDYRDSQYRSDDGNFNLDLGATLDVPGGLTFGLMARDLIANDYDVVSTGEQFRYQIQPMVSLGVAWSVGILTLSGDIDVTKQARFSDQSVSLQALQLIDDTQLVRIGAELDLLSWFELRGGIQADLQNELENVYSAGLGFSPFSVFHFDVAGLYSGENSYGAVAQLAFTF